MRFSSETQLANVDGAAQLLSTEAPTFKFIFQGTLLENLFFTKQKNRCKKMDSLLLKRNFYFSATGKESLEGWQGGSEAVKTGRNLTFGPSLWKIQGLDKT